MYALCEYVVAYDIKGLDLLRAEDVTNQNIIFTFKGNEDITSKLFDWIRKAGTIDEDWTERN